MVTGLLLSWQAVAGPVPDPPACDRSVTEIVVCGRFADPARYRLPTLAPAPEASGPPRAEWGPAGGVRAGIAASQLPFPQGMTSRRIMATIELPF